MVGIGPDVKQLTPPGGSAPMFTKSPRTSPKLTAESGKPLIIPSLALASLSPPNAMMNLEEEEESWSPSASYDEHNMNSETIIEEDEDTKAEAKEGKWRRQLDDFGGITRDAMLAQQRGM